MDGVVNPMSAAAGGARGAAAPEPQQQLEQEELPGSLAHGAARSGKLSAFAAPFSPPPPSPQAQREWGEGGGGPPADDRPLLQQQLDSLGLGQQLQLAAALTQLAAGTGAPPLPPTSLPDGAAKPAPWADALGELLVGIDRLDRGIGDVSSRQGQRVDALESRLLRAVERRRQQARAFEGQIEAFAAAVAQLAAQVAAHQRQPPQGGAPPPPPTTGGPDADPLAFLDHEFGVTADPAPGAGDGVRAPAPGAAAAAEEEEGLPPLAGDTAAADSADEAAAAGGGDALPTGVMHA